MCIWIYFADAKISLQLSFELLPNRNAVFRTVLFGNYRAGLKKPLKSENRVGSRGPSPLWWAGKKFSFLMAKTKVRVDPFFRDLDQFTILLPVKDLSSVHNPYFLAMKNMITIRSRSFFFKAENWKYSWNIVIYAVICWKNNLKLQWSDLFPISSPQNVIGDQITIIYDFQNVI